MTALIEALRTPEERWGEAFSKKNLASNEARSHEKGRGDERYDEARVTTPRPVACLYHL